MEKEQRLCAMKLPGKASILCVSPQNGYNSQSVSAALGPAVEILLQISSERSGRTGTARSSRGTPGGAQMKEERGTEAVVK